MNKSVSLKVEPLSGRPAIATYENIDRVLYMVKDNGQLTINEIADNTSMYHNRVEIILHN